MSISKLLTENYLILTGLLPLIKNEKEDCSPNGSWYKC